jgi:hypothetical protein
MGCNTLGINDIAGNNRNHGGGRLLLAVLRATISRQIAIINIIAKYNDN